MLRGKSVRSKFLFWFHEYLSELVAGAKRKEYVILILETYNILIRFYTSSNKVTLVAVLQKFPEKFSFLLDK